MKQEGMIIIICMCGIILLLISVKVKSYILLNFLYRGLTGTLFILGMNYVFEILEFPSGIGLNPITFLTCAFLGFPGFLALAGMIFYSML